MRITSQSVRELNSKPLIVLSEISAGMQWLLFPTEFYCRIMTEPDNQPCTNRLKLEISNDRFKMSLWSHTIVRSRSFHLVGVMEFVERAGSMYSENVPYKDKEAKSWIITQIFSTYLWGYNQWSWDVTWNISNGIQKGCSIKRGTMHDQASFWFPPAHAVCDYIYLGCTDEMSVFPIHVTCACCLPLHPTLPWSDLAPYFNGNIYYGPPIKLSRPRCVKRGPKGAEFEHWQS